MMTERAPDSWIKKIENTLRYAGEIPLWGSPPPFSWKKFSFELAKQLEVKEIHIAHKKTQWLEADKLLSGLGAQPYILPIALSPLNPPAFWVMSSEDISQLTSTLLYKEQEMKGFSDKSLKEGFYLFSCLNVLETLKKLHAFADLSPKLLENASLPTTDAFAIDLSITVGKQQCYGRLICTEEFQTVFKQHFALTQPDLYAQDLAKKLDVMIHFEIGRALLSSKDWKKVRIGDFLLLERCSFDFSTGKGSAVITLENTPLFQARVKPGEIKILDYAFYQEEKEFMPSDENPQEMFPSEDEFLSDETTLPGTDEQHLWSSNQENEQATEKLLSSREIPLTLVAEVARLKISLEKLLQMKPGNVLSLSVGPQTPIDLTLNGQPVARGELVQLGEVLGVKILKMGE